MKRRKELSMIRATRHTILMTETEKYKYTLYAYKKNKSLSAIVLDLLETETKGFFSDMDLK
jgi:hypothetical protein